MHLPVARKRVKSGSNSIEGSNRATTLKVRSRSPTFVRLSYALMVKVAESSRKPTRQSCLHENRMSTFLAVDW